jgi:hypothetical protein
MQVAEDRRHDVAANLPNDVAVVLVIAAAGHDVRHEGHGPVGREAGLRWPSETVQLDDARRQAIDGGLGVGSVGMGDHDIERERRALGPLLVEQVDRLHAIDGVRERREVRLTHVQP